MGTDLYLILNKKQVADLGRAHNYENYTDNQKLHIIKDILSHLCYQPQNHDELLEITDEIIEAIDDFSDNEYKRGQIDLLENLRQQGFETMTDYEWKEQEKLNNMPDYFEPKI